MAGSGAVAREFLTHNLWLVALFWTGAALLGSAFLVMKAPGPNAQNDELGREGGAVVLATLGAVTLGWLTLIARGMPEQAEIEGDSIRATYRSARPTAGGKVTLTMRFQDVRGFEARQSGWGAPGLRPGMYAPAAIYGRFQDSALRSQALVRRTSRDLKGKSWPHGDEDLVYLASVNATGVALALNDFRRRRGLPAFSGSE